MSIQKYIGATKVTPTPLVNFNEFSSPIHNALDLTELVECYSALEQITNLEASISKVMEIEDDATARIALAVVLSSSDYDSIRPSFEGSEESDTKEESKGVLKKLIAATKAIIGNLINKTKAVIEDFFTRDDILTKDILRFENSLKTLKGKPKEDKIIPHKFTSFLFSKKAFSEERFKISSTSYIIDASKICQEMANDVIATLEKGEKSPYSSSSEAIDAYWDESLKRHKNNGLHSRLSVFNGPVFPMKAMGVDELSKMAGLLSADVTKMRGAKKEIDKLSKILKGIMADAEAEKDDKALVKGAELVAVMLSLLLKSILTNALKFNTVRLYMLISHEKNIQQV
jgi:Ni,Fe-hydrogenase I large subunit